MLHVVEVAHSLEQVARPRVVLERRVQRGDGAVPLAESSMDMPDAGPQLGICRGNPESGPVFVERFRALAIDTEDETRREMCLGQSGSESNGDLRFFPAELEPRGRVLILEYVAIEDDRASAARAAPNVESSATAREYSCSAVSRSCRSQPGRRW
jgi:hypothetical protein